VLEIKKTVIVGYNGHAYVVAESYISMGNQLNFYTEKKECLRNPLNLKYLGFFHFLHK
jgi:acetyltransferase EpsM